MMPHLNETSCAAGRQTAVLAPFDWGPGLARTILTLDRPIDAISLEPEKFRVREQKRSFDRRTRTDVVLTVERKVTAARLCAADGRLLRGASPYIALDLACEAPYEGCPVYTDEGQHGVLDPQYRLKVSLEAPLRDVDGYPVTALAVQESIDWQAARIPALEGFDLTGRYDAGGGRQYRYAFYRPGDGRRHPLVIWLHGAGEGGSDLRMALLGNRVTALREPPFQRLMGGACLLVPQCPDFWLTYTADGDWKGNPGRDSVHLEALLGLIRRCIDSCPEVDPRRVYLTGCSNGGFMTMDLLFRAPELFAAAAPCCEAFPDDGITDEMLQRIRDIPLWLVWAENDRIVPPERHALPTWRRLSALGAPELRRTVLKRVTDPTGLYCTPEGAPYEYNGHFSWVPFLDGVCRDAAGEYLWHWLAVQRRR